MAHKVALDILEVRRRLKQCDLDVSVSGKTPYLAKQVLAEHNITTLVMKGQADLVLLPEIAECVRWSWQEIA